ncbi:MAG: hypothetical protein IKX24_08075 [Prevotella sp.]|nr:hypothetical protein [Prevotella sp.]
MLCFTHDVFWVRRTDALLTPMQKYEKTFPMPNIIWKYLSECQNKITKWTSVVALFATNPDFGRENAPFSLSLQVAEYQQDTKQVHFSSSVNVAF